MSGCERTSLPSPLTEVLNPVLVSGTTAEMTKGFGSVYLRNQELTFRICPTVLLPQRRAHVAACIINLSRFEEGSAQIIHTLCPAAPVADNPVVGDGHVGAVGDVLEEGLPPVRQVPEAPASGGGGGAGGEGGVLELGDGRHGGEGRLGVR